MMLIGLGEPFMDRKIFDRIEYCERHGISTLLSTNGTFLDEKAAAKLLDSPLAHITLSFDGASKETFEHYRKGARFEKVRDNFVRFARMKHARKSKMQMVVQMVRMPENAHEVDEFRRFWSAVAGVDQVRVKEDETNLVQAGSSAGAVPACGAAITCGAEPMYVKHDGRVFPCCQSYMLDGAPVGDLRGARSRGNISIPTTCGDLRRLARGRARGGDRYVLALLHRHPASAAGGRKPAGAREMGAPRACR